MFPPPQYYLVFCALLGVASASTVLSSQWGAGAVDPVEEMVQRCENGSGAAETRAAECVWSNFTLQCYSGLTGALRASALRYRKAAHVILCHWPSGTFNASLLRHFPKVQTLHVEGGNFSHVSGDFPDLVHLERVTITRTMLRHTRPTLFSRLPALKMIDLRGNQLQHVDGPLLLPYGFEGMYLSSNPWNCSRNFKWLLNSAKARRIVDRNQLECMDSRFVGRPLLTITQYKQVRLSTRKGENVLPFNEVSLEQTLRELCHSNDELRNCTCELSYVLPGREDGVMKPLYSVNCSDLGFYNLPKEVPENTTIFYAMDNHVRRSFSLFGRLLAN